MKTRDDMQKQIVEIKKISWLKIKHIAWFYILDKSAIKR